MGKGAAPAARPCLCLVHPDMNDTPGRAARFCPPACGCIRATEPSPSRPPPLPSVAARRLPVSSCRRENLINGRNSRGKSVEVEIDEEAGRGSIEEIVGEEVGRERFLELGDGAAPL